MDEKHEPVTRVTRSKEEARDVYSKLSRWYDTLTGSYEWKYTEAAIKSINIKEGDVVLEIGFGTGHGILALTQSAGPLGKVHGIDIAEGMRQVAQQRLDNAGLTERVALITGDAAELPYQSAAFDAVLISFTLELFDTPEIPLVLAECRRVLKNGGRISVVAMSKGDAGLGVRIYEWLHLKFPAWIDCRPIYPRESLADAGFIILELEEYSMAGLPGERVLAEKPE